MVFVHGNGDFNAGHGIDISSKSRSSDGGFTDSAHEGDIYNNLPLLRSEIFLVDVTPEREEGQGVSAPYLCLLYNP